MRRNTKLMNEKEYYNLIKPYEDAMQMLLSRLDTLNHTLYESSATHPVPIHNIQSRIKSKKSIEDKLIKKEKSLLWQMPKIILWTLPVQELSAILSMTYIT